MSQPEGRAPARARAWRIDYLATPQAALRPRETIRQPRSCHVYAEEMEAVTALGLGAGDVAPRDGALAPPVIFVFLPAGSGTGFDIQQMAERWIASRPGEHGAPIEILFRSERLLWRSGRAICFGTDQTTEEILSAVSHFSLCESELSRLETQVEQGWSALEQDVNLIHAVSKKDLARQAHVNAMTRMITATRIAFVRLQTALDVPGAELSGPARRIFSELAQQADSVERLKMLDDAIEVAEDVYESANDRLTEFAYFSREYRIEIFILIVLLFELEALILGIIK